MNLIRYQQPRDLWISFTPIIMVSYSTKKISFCLTNLLTDVKYGLFNALILTVVSTLKKVKVSHSQMAHGNLVLLVMHRFQLADVKKEKGELLFHNPIAKQDRQSHKNNLII